MGGLFGGGPSAPAPAPPPPSITDPEIEAARRTRLKQQADMRGRMSTLLTGDTGGDTTLAPTSAAALLGR